MFKELNDGNVELTSFPPIVDKLLAFVHSKDLADVFFVELCALFARLSVQFDQRSQHGDGSAQLAESVRELHHIEGTLLLLCEFAMRHNQALAGKLIVLVKRDQVPLTSPFAIALVLSAGCIARHEQAAFAVIKAAVLRTCDVAVQLDSMPFATVRDCIEKLLALPSAASTRTAHGVASPTATLSALLATVEHSESGWDHVVPALVQLGESLLRPARVQAPVFALGASVGRALLAQLFLRRPASRSEIMQ